MTEASEDGNHVVRVRAQVMMRDDSTGGWVPMGGGGLSNVSVRKRDISRDNDEHKHEYLIFGKRISDQSVVLSCIIKKDFEYYKVMPTFHHWKTGDKKFGLTFQTAADARAFDKGVRMAVEELLDVADAGLSDCNVPHQKLHCASPVRRAPQSENHCYRDSLSHCPQHKPYCVAPSLTHLRPATFTPNWPWNPTYEGVGEDDVFMTLNLPVEIGDSRSSSDSSKGGGGSSHRATSPTESHHLHRIHYIPRRDKMGSDQDRSPPESKQLQQHEEGGDGVRSSEKETYSYVQLTAMHEYIYPVMEDQKASRRDSASSLKKRSLEVIPTQPPLLPTKPGGKKTDRHAAYWNRCRHCQELYLEGENGRGSCEYAPDCVRAGINAVACISCAECMLYHCMADAEGDFAQHPCECGVVDENCGRRWVGLALLSLLVPCLWCYPPLRACHWCCVSCGICGGRHRPAS
ncbi:sprouty-related, EVH1 domain-containing protein 2 isoform X2 [Zootermopsis nevadensis]|uniref:sprouty-related, EVH1 domain-containing protein 2 isoform X2 n=1 Tax=Zootermopsis nevadensis TaxID=136037 RepID=UPI000B8ED5F8|nr:sprouty-related, EVH1 domain-containing protein 2 isoform X2 [Zootermopsis nevadensis]